MIEATLSWAGQQMGATLHGCDGSFAGVSTDTRSVTPGQLFFALRGASFDGHEFLDKAACNGAAAAAVERLGEIHLAQLLVSDARQALGCLARAWRQRLQPSLVAVTGSNGKTTVKELLASILSRVAPTLATAGNLNNEIGLPLTLLALASGQRYAVVELGASGPGEIARLTDMAQPSVGVVNNAGPAHLEGFGSLDGVARAKGELLEGLDAGATAVFNGDDQRAHVWRDLAGSRRRLEFGLEPGRDVRAVPLSRGGNAFTLSCAAGSTAVVLPLPGAHNVLNALAAASAALALGIALHDIRAGLEEARGVPHRLQVLVGRRGCRLVDDCYNANPVSLAAALEAVSRYPGERWLVLGDMLELGGEAELLHADAGQLAAQLGFARLFGLGELSRSAAEAFGPQGKAYATVETLCRDVCARLPPNASRVSVLIKGSRGMRLERVVAALAAAEEAR